MTSSDHVVGREAADAAHHHRGAEALVALIDAKHRVDNAPVLRWGIIGIDLPSHVVNAAVRRRFPVDHVQGDPVAAVRVCDVRWAKARTVTSTSALSRSKLTESNRSTSTITSRRPTRQPMDFRSRPPGRTRPVFQSSSRPSPAEEM